MKLKVKLKDKSLPLNVTDKGDWIDLCVAEDTIIKADTYPAFKIVPLNVAMELPKGCEAIVAPRSSTYKNFGIICANSFGVIDNSYCGDNDWWGFPALAFKEVHLKKGDRICQFRIQLSQKANLEEKKKWQEEYIELEYVDKLEGADRGGFGTTGKN